MMRSGLLTPYGAVRPGLNSTAARVFMCVSGAARDRCVTEIVWPAERLQAEATACFAQRPARTTNWRSTVGPWATWR